MAHQAPRLALRRPHPMRWRQAGACVAAVILLLTSRVAPAEAQIVRGRVLDDATTTGIDGVSLTLLDERREPRLTTTSDAEGRFRFGLRSGGRYALRVERTGYRGFIAEAVIVGADEEVALELRLASDEIVVAPIAVLGRRRTGSTADFEQRLRLMRLAGIGHTLTRTEIARLPVLDITDLLAAVPGVLIEGPPSARRVLFTTGSVLETCAPAVFVNAEPLDEGSVDRLGTPETVDAVELYNGPVESPAEFSDPTGCGVVLLWLRPDPADAQSMKWRRAVVYIGMTAIGIVLFSR